MITGGNARQSRRYSGYKTFTISPWIGAVLLFSFAVEIGQYFRLAELLGLMDCKVARIVIGSTFDAKDLLAYAIGAALVLVSTRFHRGCDA